MSKPKPTSRFLLSPLILLLLLLLLLPTISSQDTDPDDLNDLQELLSLDQQEQEEEEPQNLQTSEVLSKAQRIVLELNNDNAKRAVEENEFVLVLGYAPWCSRSAELMPRFAEAANVMKGLGSHVLMAKVDGERYPKVAASLGIKGFPTLVLFVNGSSVPYSGGFTSEELVIWARKKTGSPVIRINAEAEATEFLKQHSMYAVGLFNKFEGREYEEFFKAAADENEIQFVETSSTDVAKVLFPVDEYILPFFGLVKNEPEHYTSLDGNLSAERILLFLESNKFPLVTIMTELNSAKVYSSTNKLQVYAFSEAENLKKLIDPLRDIAKKFKSEIMFAAVDINEENLAKPFLTLFGLEESEETVVVAFDYSGNLKYLLEADPTSRNIEEFCVRLVQGTQSAYYKSQPIPDNKNTSILTVVGKTFDDLVLSSSANVLLEVHTPWCTNCETTSKQMEKLAKHFRGLDNLVFARIDASINEHPKLQVEDYPTLLFYPANNKSNPIKFSTKSSLKELATLVNQNLKAKDSQPKDEL